MVRFTLLRSYSIPSIGLSAVSTKTSGGSILAFLDSTSEGVVQIRDFQTNKNKSIEAHKSALRCIELSSLGTMLATASEKGTLIRVFSTFTSEMIIELRRGTQEIIVNSLAFDSLGKWLACSSISGTVHVFTIPGAGVENKNQRSKLSFMKFISGYFDSEWSFARFHMKEQTENKTIFLETFSGTEQTDVKLAVVTKGGKFITLGFDAEIGGDCEVNSEKDLKEL